MNKEIIEASAKYSEGLITPREYLGLLIDILGKKWNSLDPESSTDKEVNDLARQLDISL